jgi:predicted ATPase/DNA-binding winged helix-turn-helix (wHTH) protein
MPSREGIVRLGGESVDQVIYRSGECEIDSLNRKFVRAGKEYSLEPKVFAVLIQLFARPGELLTRDALLDAVWGHRYVTPSTLNRVIALARRALADDVETPRFIQTVHGTGYRYIGPVEKAISMATDRRARFGPPNSVRLPARLQSLIGRDRELSQIEAFLRDGRSVTVVGSGGMGKTQCALASAHQQLGYYPDGVWFFDLAPLRSADQWLQALAFALSIAPSPRTELIEKVCQTLTGRRLLLLLDNCDRLSVEVGSILIELLRGTEHLKVLATSQQQLNFLGERILRIPSLKLPAITNPADAGELLEVESAPAVSLLLQRVRDMHTDFGLTTSNAPAIVGICERLDGMPLAIEFAAARFALLSPEQVLERLDQRFSFLVGGVAGRDRRHRNLVALLEWSFALLSPDEQRLLCWLGAFVQGWSVEAVIDLAGAFGSCEETTVDLLLGLAQKSLVSVDQSASPPRYRLLETVREFALEQLALMGEETLARDAHLAHVLRLAESAHLEMVDGRMRERIAVLRLEHGNIDAASEYAAGSGDQPQAALRIAGRLTLYFKANGEGVFARRLCERALAIAPPMRSRDRAMALMCLGISIVVGTKDLKDGTLSEAVSIALEIGDAWTAAYSSGYLAMWFCHIGAVHEVEPHLQVVERVARQLGDDLLHSLAGLVRGWRHLVHEEIDAALAALWPIRCIGGDFHQHHFVGMYIGLSLFRLHDHRGAAAQWHEAMRNAMAVGHLRGMAGSIEGCAYIAERRGAADVACRFLSVADKIRVRSGSPLFSFWFRHNEFAHASLRASMGVPAYEAALQAGMRMREEDAINEAMTLLAEFGAADADDSVQASAKIPVGS